MDGRLLNISKEDVAGIIAMNGPRSFFHTQTRAFDQTSIDETSAPSIDSHRERFSDQNGGRKVRWKRRDEYGIYKDKDGYARAADGIIIPVSREDIRAILERSAMVGHTHISIPEYAEVPTTTVPEHNTYSKTEIYELVEGIYRAIRTVDDYFTKGLDDIYYPFNNSIGWLTTRTDEMKQDIAMIQEQHVIGAGTSKSIDVDTKPSIDARLASFEDRLQSFDYKLDGVYYPLKYIIERLTTMHG